MLVPNPFYRVAKAPFTDASTFNFAKDRAKITPLMASVNAAGNAEKDAIAYVAFLDAQKQVNKAKKIGTQGYCMGGPLVVRTAATMPDRIGAGASFHGGGLVTDKPDSPHLLAPKIKAQDVFRHRIERRQDVSRTPKKAEGSFAPRRRRSKCIRRPAWLVRAGHAEAGRTACRSITSPMPNAPGSNSWLSTKPG